MRYDALIIGGGYCGLSAGITLARANRKVVIVDSQNPRNVVSKHAHGILGMDNVSPAEILAKGTEEYLSFGGLLLHELVSQLSKGADGDWLATLSDEAHIKARSCLVATGLSDKLPDIAGLEKLWGKTVFHCPYCHGFELNGKRIAVIGGANRNFSLHQAFLLKLWSDEIDLIVNGMYLSKEERARLISWGVCVVDDLVIGMESADDIEKGSVSLQCIETKSRQYGSVFVGPVFSPNDFLLRETGCLIENSWVKTEIDGKTSEEGLWAGGNCVSSPDQIPNAMSAGVNSAISMNHYLLYNDVDLAESRVT